MCLIANGTSQTSGTDPTPAIQALVNDNFLHSQRLQSIEIGRVEDPKETSGG